MTLITLALAGWTTCAAPADDWPQWRGPHQNGLSTETEWSQDSGDDLWSAEVGLGYSAVIVVDGKAFTMGWEGEGKGADGAGEDVVWCLDAESGDVVWSHRFPAKKWEKYHGGGTNCTPSYADGMLFVANREGKLLALDAATGDVRWEEDLLKQHNLELPTWGFACSPLVVDKQVVVNFGRVFSFTTKGKEMWKTDDLGHGYATPTPITVDGKECLAGFNGSGFNLLDRKSGKVLQTHEWKTKYDVNASSPVLMGDDRVFIASGYNHGSAALKVSTKGSPELLWENKKMKTQMAGAVLHDGHLYGFDGQRLQCMNLDGEVEWEHRGLGQGAHCIAGGWLIVIGDQGQMLIAEANPEGFDPVGEWEVLDGGPCWTPPVLVDGLIYLRNQKGQLVCRDHAAAAPRE